MQWGWKVGDQYFNNKFIAVKYAIDNPLLSFNAYLLDEYLDEYDWTIEPDQTVEELQRQRAIQLREKYNTIVLCYGGGTDCHTLLQTFIKFKIPLDYICVWYVGSNPDTKWNLDTQLSIKYLNENKDKLMGAKVLYDRKLDNYEGNSIFNHKPGNDISKTNYQLVMHHIGYGSTVQIRHPALYEKVLKNGCILTGGNKPFIYKDENGYHSLFYDQDDESWGESNLEMFYIGSAPLIIKQSHLAKKWLIKNKQFTGTDIVYRTNNNQAFKSLNESLGRIFMHERFLTKPNMRNLNYIVDNYFGSHKWNDEVTHYKWAKEWPNWEGSESYNDLLEQWRPLLYNKKFTGSNKRLIGWLCTKRYLQ